MVRNLMLIAGLSLSVAALGCSSDGGGTGGSGGTAGAGGEPGTGGDAGSGGAGGSGGEITDACTNAEDLAIVCEETFTDDVETCAGTVQGDAAGTAMCLVDDFGVSPDCATCYGNESQCSRDRCALGGDTSCLPPAFGGMFGPGTPQCEACQEAAGCTEARDTCTGDLETACAM